ncbi:MAG: DUF7535 family protein [Halobacteriota archaeon]
MSAELEEPEGLQRAYRSIGPWYRSHPDAEMDAIGLGILVGLVVLFAPLLPFVLVAWILTKVLDFLGSIRGVEEEA